MSEPIKYSELFQKDDSIETLLSQLKEVREEYQKVKTAIATSARYLRDSMASVSGASSEGQAAIKQMASETDKLARKNAELRNIETLTHKELLKVNDEIKEKNRAMILERKVTEATTGSYDQLSARYAQLKTEVRKYSKAELETNEAAKAMVAELKAIYEEMDRFEKATGKSQLSVGNYTVATANMASKIRNAVQVLAQYRAEMNELKEAGKTNTDRFRELSTAYAGLSKETAKLKKEYNLVKIETQALGNQTGILNDVLGAASATSGGLALATASMQAMGLSTDRAVEAQTRLQTALTAINGVSAIYNGIFKQGNILLRIRTIQEALFDKAVKLSTKSTWAAVAAQKALAAVAYLNPYAIVAAGIGLIVAGLLAWSSTGKRTLDLQKRQIKIGSEHLKFLESIDTEQNRILKEDQKRLEQELAIAKVRRASYAETDKLEGDILRQREIANAKSRGFYSDLINDVDKNRAELERLQRAYYSFQGLPERTKVSFNLDPEGPVEEFKVSKLLEAIQEKINLYKDKVEIPVKLLADKEQIEADLRALEEQRKQHALAVAALERSAFRETEDVRFQLMNQRFDRERAETKAATARAIVDLQVRLQTESNLTEAARAELNAKMVLLRQKLARDLTDIDNAEIAANLASFRETEDLKFESTRDSAAKRRKILETEYERESYDIRRRLETERELTITERDNLYKQLGLLWDKYLKDSEDLENQIRVDELNRDRQALQNRLEARSKYNQASVEMQLVMMEKERDVELAENKLLAEDMKQDESDIRAKWDRKIAQARLQLESEVTLALLNKYKAYLDSSLVLTDENTTKSIELRLKKMEAERAEEIARNRALDETLRQDESLINQKWDQKILRERIKLENQKARETLSVDQRYESSVFNLRKRSEIKRARFELKQRKQTLMQELAEQQRLLLAATDQESKLRISKTIEAIRNEMIAIDREIKEVGAGKYSSIWDVFGFDATIGDALSTLTDQILSALQDIASARLEAAQAAVDAAQKEVDATKLVYEAELQAMANGYANNVEYSRKELELAKENKRKALEEERKAAEAQEAINTVMQVGSLVTASANLWSSFSPIPYVGPALAVAAIATMWASFAASKVMASRLANQKTESYGQGTVELLSGGSHQSGRDVDLGRRPNGTRRRAEGGEFFAVINKRNSRKFRSTIPDVIHSLNDGTFADKYRRSQDVVSEMLMVPGTGGSVNLSRVETDLRSIRDSISSRTFVSPDGSVVKVRGSLTQRIKS